jgi:hypothetical protein
VGSKPTPYMKETVGEMMSKPDIVCPCCKNSYDADYPGMAQKWKAFEMGIRRDERARIRKALALSKKELLSRSPGTGDSQDPWVGAIRGFYNWAITDVRR